MKPFSLGHIILLLCTFAVLALGMFVSSRLKRKQQNILFIVTAFYVVQVFF